MKRSSTYDCVYSCLPCDFRTDKFSNFKRHKGTDKHLKNTLLFDSSANIIAPQCTDDGNVKNIEPQCTDDGDDYSDGSATETPAITHQIEYEEVIGETHSCNEQEACVDDSTDTSSQNEQRPDNDNSSWFPFESKLQMYLYILIHSKTHILSDDTANFIWHIMKECAGIEMPSLNSIKNLRFGDLTPDSLLLQTEGPDGTPFWTLKPSSLIKMAISHPSTANDLIRYARICGNDNMRITEQPDGYKWKKHINSHWATNGKSFLYLGDFVIDEKDQQKIGKIQSFYQDVELDVVYARIQVFKQKENDQESLICLQTEIDVNINHLLEFNPEKFNFFKEVDQTLRKLTDGEREAILKTSDFKCTMRPVVSVPVNIFMDDTSANKSKKWKPLHCIQLQLAGLPKNKKQDMQNIKFIATSSEVGVLDMMEAVKSDIKELKRSGIEAFDASRKETVTVVSDLALCVCDFNMLAEASNHMGANTLMYCPRCYADSSTCTTKGPKRNPEKTLRILQHLTVHNDKNLRQRYGLKPYNNCMWDIINPHRDIPVGLLHWMYLGLGKHLIKSCISSLHVSRQSQLKLIIDNMDQSSLETKVTSDLISFIDSRQGKDIKSYLQVAPFHFFVAGLDTNKVKLLCKLAELSKILTACKEFSREDLEELQLKINEYLQQLANIFPELLLRVKTHLSTHIIDDIQTHGPLLGYQEDAFEKMHGRIRDQLFIQNQHARSRDTATAFAEIEILQHLLTGGYFKDEDLWVQASMSVQAAGQNPHIRHFLGLKKNTNDTSHGSLKKAFRTATSKLRHSNIRQDDRNEINNICQDHGIRTESCSAVYFRAVKTMDGGIANQKNPVLYKDVDGMEKIGLLEYGIEVQDRNSSLSLVKIQKMVQAQEYSDSLGCKRLCLTDTNSYVKSSCVLQNISLIHDCVREGCRVSDSITDIFVEQVMKGVQKRIWKHKYVDNVYFVNRFHVKHKKNKYYSN